jgi:hypothetical protein
MDTIDYTINAHCWQWGLNFGFHGLEPLSLPSNYLISCETNQVVILFIVFNLQMC